MTIQPLDDRILVQRIENEDRTDSGIIVPEQAQEKPQRGVVRAVGPGKVGESGERVEPQVSEDDTVLFGKYSGTDVTVQGEEHLILRENEVLAILED